MSCTVGVDAATAEGRSWDTEVTSVTGLGAVEAAAGVTGLGVAAGGRS